MARKVPVDIYAQPDLIQQVESYAGENDLSASAAWRELARRGLQAEGNG